MEPPFPCRMHGRAAAGRLRPGIDNSVRILDESAQESLAEYIARPPISLKKIRYEQFKGKVLFHTKYSQYFKQNVHLFDALDFLAELTQHIPPKRLQLIRRYGQVACASSTRQRATRAVRFPYERAAGGSAMGCGAGT